MALVSTYVVPKRNKGLSAKHPSPCFYWLPFVDTYRTLCLAPDPQLKRVFEEIRNFDMAA